MQFLSSRPVVFTLALISFACLLGQFYGLWTMHWFGCWVLLPSTFLLISIAYRHRDSPLTGMASPYVWIVYGTVWGIAAAVVYDLYRLPFVLAGTPLFKVFPRFGELLLGGAEPRWAVHVLGWLYHFSNGAALGIMYLVLASALRIRNLLWGAVLWALFVEMMLLVTPYTAFFGLKLNSWFLFLTASAHLIFGLTLGLFCQRRLENERGGNGRARCA